MTKHDIILTFFTVVYGMMFIEIGTRIHILLRNRKFVKWYSLPVLSSWLILLIVLKNWWYLILGDFGNMSVLKFVYFGHLLIIFYLLTTSVLPDKIEKKGIDLKMYYFNNHKYFWGIFSFFIFLSFIQKIIESFYSNTFHLFDVLGFAFPLLFSLLLFFFRKSWLHFIVITIFIVKNISEIISLNQ